ncbi:hypothetical protein VTO42DRAFT_1899 [Malbranchea cinnamomea]
MCFQVQQTIIFHCGHEVTVLKKTKCLFSFLHKSTKTVVRHDCYRRRTVCRGCAVPRKKIEEQMKERMKDSKERKGCAEKNKEGDRGESTEGRKPDTDGVDARAVVERERGREGGREGAGTAARERGMPGVEEAEVTTQQGDNGDGGCGGGGDDIGQAGAGQGGQRAG